MTDSEDSEFEERLLELNNWQMEQQIKLRKFQEAQRKLLDSEHEKILNSLKTQSSNHRHDASDKSSQLIIGLQDIETDADTQVQVPKQNYLLNFHSDEIRLKDPNLRLSSVTESEKCGDLEDNVNVDCDLEDNNQNKTRRFLRRGDGLARFRMTFDDFKTPPTIYREKRIKTYLNQKPDIKRRSVLTRTGRSCLEVTKNNKKPASNCRTKPVPVKIYVPETNTKRINSGRSNCSSDGTSSSNVVKSKENNPPKVPVRNLTLKPLTSSNFLKSIEGEVGSYQKASDKAQDTNRILHSDPLEKQLKKDERELRMFEMLENKIDEGSLSPNSSIVARFMEESMSSTPTKPVTGKDESFSYLESLRALQKQYLTQEQIERIQECENEFSSNEDTLSEEEIQFDDRVLDIISKNYNQLDIIEEEDKVTEESIKEFETGVCEVKSDDQEDYIEFVESPKELYQPKKNVLTKYVSSEKQTSDVTENCTQVRCADVVDLTAETEVPMENQIPSQREIAIKLQRKALQDNVKNLLNWEGVQRRKQAKTAKKSVTYSKPCKKMKSKQGDDKPELPNADLKAKMDELEKEIEIFKRENKNLSQMQRECEAAKSKLEKERKDLQQEREELYGKINEEQKKLQREKVVFDKYCKHIKSQPNKKEREEIKELKSEVARLTEVLSTKEARWGASQARLRNQIKSLEKDNQELKAEIEKLKKPAAKKVSFEGVKTFNTKIINAINCELGKMKPSTMKNMGGKLKIQCYTARVEGNAQKNPLRRIKSVPDLKKSSETGSVNEPDENFNTSPVTTDGDGKGPTRSPLSSDDKRDADVLFKSPVVTTNDQKFSKDCNFNFDHRYLSTEERNKNVFKDDNKIPDPVTYLENRDRGDHDNTSGTISEIKRRLENLNLLHQTDRFNGDGDRNAIASEKQSSDCDSEDSSEDVDDDEETDEYIGRKDVKIISPRACDERSSTHPNFLYQTKVDCNGIREKNYDDGRKEIIYPNGNIKKISADARIVKMIYYNGDLKETDVAEGSEKYYYSETRTWHTTYKDGLEVLEFPNGQTERRHPNGSIEILFPNGCVRYCDSTGRDEWRFLDGTVIKTDKNGHKVLLLPNGQKEIHTKEYKRREYPDGTVKLLYSDGTQETRYATGRVRLKDKDGNLVMDSGGIR